MYLHVMVRAVLYADFAPIPDPDPRYWPTLILAETPMQTGNCNIRVFHDTLFCEII